MKKSRYVFFCVLFLIVQHLYCSNPDEWRGSKGRFILHNWSANINIGFTSYFGDLSQYDRYFAHKLIYESDPAVGLKLTKYINNLFGISGQLIYGGFKSNYRPEFAFSTSLFEYSLQAGLDVLNLIFSRKLLDYGLEVYVGTGQFVFKTTRIMNFDGQQVNSPLVNSTPEFVYFFGGGLFFEINNKFRLTADLSIRQAQNDNIDKYIKLGDFDYYSVLSFGVTYAINKIFVSSQDDPRNKVNKGSPVWR